MNATMKNEYYRCEDCWLYETAKTVETHECGKIRNLDFNLLGFKEIVLRIGKRRFVRIINE